MGVRRSTAPAPGVTEHVGGEMEKFLSDVLLCPKRSGSENWAVHKPNCAGGRTHCQE